MRRRSAPWTSEARIPSLIECKSSRRSGHASRSLRASLIGILALVFVLVPTLGRAEETPIILVHGVYSDYRMWGEWDKSNGAWESGSFLDFLGGRGVTFGGSLYIDGDYNSRIPTPSDVGVLLPYDWNGRKKKGTFQQFRTYYPMYLRDQSTRHVFTVTTSEESRTWGKDYRDEATELRAYIQCVRELTGASKVILVGHSKGGLVTTYYTLRRKSGDPVYVEDFPGEILYQNDVKEVITFGAPFLGPIRQIDPSGLFRRLLNEIWRSFWLWPGGKLPMENYNQFAFDSDAMRALRECSANTDVEYVNLVVDDVYEKAGNSDHGLGGWSLFGSLSQTGREFFRYGSDDVVPVSSQILRNALKEDITKFAVEWIPGHTFLPLDFSVLHIQESNSELVQLAVWKYISETGFSVSGILIDEASGEPLGGARYRLINMSDRGTVLYENTSHDVGSYYISVSSTPSQPILMRLEAESTSGTKVHRDFAVEPSDRSIQLSELIVPTPRTYPLTGQTIYMNADSTPPIIGIDMDPNDLDEFISIKSYPHWMIPSAKEGNGRLDVELRIDRNTMPEGHSSDRILVYTSDATPLIIPVEFDNVHPDSDAHFKDDLSAFVKSARNSPGATFNKTWRLQNSGTSTWNSSYHLTHIGGDLLGTPTSVSVPMCGPGQEVDITVPMRVPSTRGVYTSRWRMQDPQGRLFGDPIWVTILSGDANEARLAGQYPAGPKTLLPGQRATFRAEFENTGYSLWMEGIAGVASEGHCELRACDANGVVGPDTSPFESPLYPGDGDAPLWINRNRVVSLPGEGTAPGNIGTFEFEVQIPSTLSPGRHDCYFRLYVTENRDASYPVGGIVKYTIDVPAGQVSAPTLDNTPPFVGYLRPAGGEQLPAGQIKQIRWAAYDESRLSGSLVASAGIDHVVVQLERSDNSLEELVDTTGFSDRNPLYYNWLVSLPSGDARLVVTASDAAGNTTTIRGEWFEILPDCDGLERPVLRDFGRPIDGDSFFLYWQSVQGASSYSIQESASSDFNSVRVLTSDVAQYRIAGRANDIYYYRAKAHSDCGESAWSNTIAVEVRKNRAPFAASNFAPADETSRVSLDLEWLSWRGGDPDGDNLEYILGFGIDADPLRLENGYRPWRTGWMDQPAWSLSDYDLQPGTTYYWWVDSRDPRGLITEGPLVSFRTEEVYPDLAPLHINVTGEISLTNPVTVSVEVYNLGILESSSYIVDFYYSTSPSEKQLLLGTLVGAPALGPNEHVWVNRDVTLSSLQSGRSYILADVRMNGSTPESSLENNLHFYPIDYANTQAPDIHYFCIRGCSSAPVKTGISYAMQAAVEDDIGLASADFEYSYDGFTWLPGEMDRQLSGWFDTIDYIWTVPSNAPTGDGALQLRIRVEDTDGNISSFVQIKDVRDGSLPIVHVLTPNGGERWPLGSTQTISWEFESGNPPVDLDIRDSGAGFVWENVYDAPTQGSIEIQVPNSGASDELKIVITATDSEGNEAADESDGFFSIYNPDNPPPAPWGTPVVVTAPPSRPDYYATSNSLKNPSTATDQAGNLFLLYEYEHQDIRDSQSGDSTLHYETQLFVQEKTSTGWQPAEQITNFAEWTDRNDCPTHDDRKYSLSDAQIQIDSDGNLHVIYIWGYRDSYMVPGGPCAGQIYCSAQYHDDVYYMKRTNGTWTSPVNISYESDAGTNTSRTNGAKLLVSSNGEVCVLWEEEVREYIPIEGQCWRYDYSTLYASEVLYEKRFSGGSWGSLIPHPEEVRRADFAIDSAGELHALIMGTDVSGNCELHYYSQSAGTWGPPVAVMTYDPDGTGCSSNVSLALDSNDDPHFLWTVPNMSNLDLSQANYRSMDGTALSDVRVVETGWDLSMWLGDKMVQVDGDDIPHFIFPRREYIETSEVQYIGHRRAIEGVLTPSVLISDRGESVAASTPSFSFALSGTDVHVAWETSNQLIAYNGASYTMDVVDPLVSGVTVGDGVGGLSIGETVDILWVANDDTAVSSLDLELSIDDGQSWSDIALDLENTGTYSWTIPLLASDQCIIRVTAEDYSLNRGSASSSRFTIGDFTSPEVLLSSPSGGETFVSGDVTRIEWSATDNVAVTSQSLEYSLNNGSTWAQIAAPIPGKGFFDWTIPTANSSACLVRLRAVDSSSNISEDRCDTTFTVRIQNQPPIAPFEPIPADGSKVDNAAPTLQWRSSDPDLDTLSYTVFLGAPAPTTIASGLTTQTLALDPLPRNETYTWQVAAFDGVTTTTGPEWTFAVSQSLIPPRWLNGEAAGTGSIQLVWEDDNESSPTAFLDRRLAGAANYQNIASLDSLDEQFEDTGLNPNTIYEYRLRSVFGDEEAESSNEFSVSTQNSHPSQPTWIWPEPYAVDIPTSASLSWNALDPDPGDSLEFTVFFGTSNPPVEVTTQTLLIFTSPSELNYGTEYHAMVRATDSHGDFTDSPLLSFVTETEPLPDAPSDLVASLDSATTISLTWSSPSPPFVGTRIERAIGAASFEQISVTDKSSFIDSNPGDSGETVRYRVRTFNESGDSLYSNEASVTIPSPTPTPIPTPSPTPSVGELWIVVENGRPSLWDAYEPHWRMPKSSDD
ncbi:hypothetical protein KQI84_02900 [bacterium]|nr:hypothetical protein [bacterium]